MIILTPEQAEQVTGEWHGQAIQPVLLANGFEYVLPESCLYNTEYPKEIRDLLFTFPTREVNPIEFPQTEVL
jgi:hypothetical protein